MTTVQVPYCWNEKQKEKKNNFSFLMNIKFKTNWLGIKNCYKIPQNAVLKNGLEKKEKYH